jgi:hypothetical protein
MLPKYMAYPPSSRGVGKGPDPARFSYRSAEPVPLDPLFSFMEQTFAQSMKMIEEDPKHPGHQAKVQMEVLCGLSAALAQINAQAFQEVETPNCGPLLEFPTAKQGLPKDRCDSSWSTTVGSSIFDSDSTGSRKAASDPDTGDRIANTVSNDEKSGESQSDAEPFVQAVFQEFVKNVDNRGVTLMWHGIPLTWLAEPDVLDALRTINARDVTYVYMPHTFWQRRSTTNTPRRNKGYVFVHFMTSEAAVEFQETLRHTDLSTLFEAFVKPTSTTLATYQGVTANLHQLMELPRKHAGLGTLYVRADGEMHHLDKGALGVLAKLARTKGR